MKGLQRLRAYASRLRESIRDLAKVTADVLSSSVELLRNIVQIVITTIRRGARLIWEDAVDFIKSALRLVADALRWPLERAILPAMRWLVDRSGRLHTLIVTRDEVALGLFLVMVVLSCVCGCLLVSVGLAW